MDFIFKAAVQGGFDVNFNGKYMWVRITHPVMAAVQAIELISHQEGIPPGELVKSLDPEIRQGVIAYARDKMQKVQAEMAEAAPMLKLEAAKQQAMGTVTRKEAMAFLEDKIQKTKETIMPTKPGSAVLNPVELYTLISLMPSEAVFKQHRMYPQIAAEVVAARG